MLTRYGRIGSAGSTTRKDFADEAAAGKAAEKMVAEKCGKGTSRRCREAGPVVAQPARPGWLRFRGWLSLLQLARHLLRVAQHAQGVAAEYLPNVILRVSAIEQFLGDVRIAGHVFELFWARA